MCNFLRRPNGRRSNISLDLHFMYIIHQSEVFVNCNIHHTNWKKMLSLVDTQNVHTILLNMQLNLKTYM